MIPSKRLLVLLGYAWLGVAQGTDKDLGSVLSDRDDLSTFYDLIKDYPDILLQLPSDNGVTIIAPSNDAFKNIPYTSLNEVYDAKDKSSTVPLLQYHIIPTLLATSSLEAGPSILQSTLLTSSTYTNVTSGQNIILNKSNDDTVTIMSSLGTRCTVEAADIEFRGGLIHVVDNLLIPPERLEEAGDGFELNSFLGGLYKAGSMPGVAERKNVTIFAPQNKAFEAVAASLLDLDNEALEGTMGYHIIPDKVLASDSLTNGTRLPTLLESASVEVHQAGNNKYINSAQVIQPDILIANGILHIISDVLNPDAGEVLPNPEVATQAKVWPVSTLDGVFTSELPCTSSCAVTTTMSTSMSGSGSEPSTVTATLEDGSARTTESEDGARETGSGGLVMGVMGLGAGMMLL